MSKTTNPYFIKATLQMETEAQDENQARQNFWDNVNGCQAGLENMIDEVIEIKEIKEEWIEEKKIKKCKVGEHDFVWHYDSFENDRILEIDGLGIPVKCAKCGLVGVEWYSYSNIKDLKGKIVW